MCGEDASQKEDTRDDRVCQCGMSQPLHADRSHEIPTSYNAPLQYFVILKKGDGVNKTLFPSHQDQASAP